MKLTFIIRNSSLILYMSSQPLFSNLQCTLNALTATNKLNQSSPNIIDCWKLQRWESITIRHICMWPEHFWNEQHMSVDESALEWASFALRGEEPSRGLKQTEHPDLPATLLLIQSRNTHGVRDFFPAFFLHCSQLVLLIGAKYPIFQMKSTQSYER